MPTLTCEGAGWGAADLFRTLLPETGTSVLWSPADFLSPRQAVRTDFLGVFHSVKRRTSSLSERLYGLGTLASTYEESPVNGALGGVLR